ncbi:hypothetical protein [uncultured Ruminococcus sp.]|uniref:hypothetical protein n=1 Tax=uncultured Ruminococcus sp. TaxID=165186 RepID=UPI002665422F|nr:hypothetical protein [uncultured Ruminococcus sp.]
MAENNPTPNPNETQTTPQGNPAPAFDYDKLASLINGKQSVAEDTVLKSYFKEQGLSADEMKEAIGAFKEQKAKNTPDIAKMQSEVESANNAKLTAEVNQSATLEAVKQGVDVASIPYVLKMADFSAVTADGEINAEKLTEAVKKVLDDVPALKKTADNSAGVQKIGGDGNGTSDGTKPNSSVPTKKWNRFNI